MTFCTMCICSNSSKVLLEGDEGVKDNGLNMLRTVVLGNYIHTYVHTHTHHYSYVYRTETHPIHIATVHPHSTRESNVPQVCTLHRLLL